MEIYSVNLRIQSECGKIRTRKTPNTDNFHAVKYIIVFSKTFIIPKKQDKLMSKKDNKLLSQTYTDVYLLCTLQ